MKCWLPEGKNDLNVEAGIYIVGSAQVCPLDPVCADYDWMTIMK